jgi:hypothetical protein
VPPSSLASIFVRKIVIGTEAGVTDKADFTSDEWSQLLESIMMSGLAVTLADPSGLWGTLKESFASGNALLAAKQDPSANALIKAVAEDFGTAEGRAVAGRGA